jgi:preprotein translocase subunit YajC
VTLAATASSGGSSGLLLFLLGFAALFYFFVLRPQQRRRKEMQAMQNSVGVGTEVITTAGLYGTVVGIDETTVTLEVAPGVTNRYARAAVGRVVTPEVAPEVTSTDTDSGVDLGKHESSDGPQSQE